MAEDDVQVTGAEDAMAFETVDEAISTYVALRDALRAHQKQAQEIETRFKMQLDKIEMWMRDLADKLGVDSFKTESGTAYRSEKEFYKIEDWDALADWVIETKNVQIFEKRIAKTAAREIHQATKEVMPGVNYYTEIGFNVKRPTKKKGEDDE